MNDEPVQITLVGRTSAWQQRLPAGSVDHSGHALQTSRGGRPLFASWLHHPGYGTLGAYLAGDASRQRRALRRGQWVQLVGLVRPFLAYALPDDPRSAVSHEMTPLLIEATQIARTADRHWQLLLPMLPTPLQARVLRTPSSARILPLVRWADAVYWRGSAMAPLLSVDWDTVRGVVTQLGGRRYLRYVLRLSAPATHARAGTELKG